MVNREYWKGGINVSENIIKSGIKNLTDRVEVRKNVLGEEHPDTLIAKGNLVILYDKEGDYQTAIQLGEEVLEACRNVLGENDGIFSFGYP